MAVVDKLGLGSVKTQARVAKAIVLDHIGRVKSIVLDESHPRFKEAGGYTGIGTIEFEPVNNPLGSDETFPLAKPIDTNTKHYPLVGEIVALKKAPSIELETSTKDKITYYTNVVGVWGSTHQNARPSSLELQPPPSNDKSYEFTQQTGIPNVQNDQLIVYSLGNTFVEKDNIRQLQPFEGDVIYEGRWGNSIRLGSTTVNKQTSQGLNNWSQEASNPGDPITIIRNGQTPNTNEDTWIPAVENINTDQSSIYLTSTQKINIQRGSLLPSSSIKNEGSFLQPQIIITSDRVNINSKKDSILLTSRESTIIAANKFINISSKEQIVLDCSSIKLGNQQASHPVLKGDDTVKELTKLVDTLNEVMKVLEKVAVPGLTGQDAVNLTNLNQAASQAIQVLTSMKPRLEGLPSQTVFVT